jgi:hypothetical protein
MGGTGRSGSIFLLLLSRRKQRLLAARVIQQAIETAALFRIRCGRVLFERVQRPTIRF